MAKTPSKIAYPFKKTNKKIYAPPKAQETPDSIYWKKLGLPVLVKEYGAIDYLDFCPVQPYYFAATCSVRVQIYDPITKVVAKNLSQFVEGAYGATFRGDGRLLVAGSEEKVVKLFDVQSKNVLRVFTGHTGPVHRTFFTKDNLKVLSCSDDKSVGLWDIATEARVANFTEHNDYVRAGATSPISPDIILSGGYDNIVKMYDCRTNETVLTVNHGDPIESTLFLPSGGIFVSAGGTQIKVWDIFNGGKLLSCISSHHKTVTSLRLSSNNSRLISASLDRHLKFYDISTFGVVHNIDFPNAILSMAISDRDDVLAVGMVDGVISISKREHSKNKKVDTDAENKTSFKFVSDFNKLSNIDLSLSKAKIAAEPLTEKYLRKHEYSRMLATTLLTASKYPTRTTAMLQELLKRNVFHTALGGIDDHHLYKLLKFIQRKLGDTMFTRTLIDVLNVVIDVYGNQIHLLTEANQILYKNIAKRVQAEIEVCKKVSELEGAINLLLAGAQVGTAPLDTNEILAPSAIAQKEIVIDV